MRLPASIRKVLRILLIGAVLLPPVLSCRAVQAGCVSYGEYLHSLGGIPFPGHARCVDHQDRYLFVGGMDDSFVVLDVADPASMVRIGAASLPGEPYGIDVEGSVACVTLSTRAVQVLDVSRPEEPEALGLLPIPASPRGVAVAGNRAFVAAAQYMGEEGIYVIDISEPADPRIVTRVDVGIIPRNVAVDGSFAYVLTFYELVVLDIANPDDPFICGRMEMPGEGGYLLCRDEYLYIVCQCTEGGRSYGDGLYILDKTDPSHPAIVGAYAPEENPPNFGLSLWGRCAISTCGERGIGFIDVSDPSAPWLIGHVGIQEYASGLVVKDDLLFAGGSEVVSYLLREDLTPPPVATVASTEHCVVADSRGDFAYMLRSPGGELLVVDMRDPQEPLVVGSAPLNAEWSYVLAVTEGCERGPFVYVSGVGHPDSTLIFDVHDPSSPQRVGLLSIPHHPSDLEVEGDRLYAAAGASGLRIYDIEDPVNPQLTATIDFDYSISTVTAADEVLYIARRVLYHESIFVYDVTDPKDPRLLGTTQIAELPYEIVVDGPLAYVADGYDGLLILDVSDPSAIRQVSRTRGIGFAQDLAKDGSCIYVTDWNGNAGMHVIDVSDPEAPRKIGYFRSERACDVELINGHALVANQSGPAVVAPLQCAPACVSGTSGEPSTARLLLCGNPARGGLRVELHLRSGAPGRLAVIDPAGRIVKTLHDAYLGQGTHLFRWDGRDRFGRRCAAGVYFVSLEAGRARAERSIVYLP